jgi:hypothetical protein
VAPFSTLKGTVNTTPVASAVTQQNPYSVTATAPTKGIQNPTGLVPGALPAVNTVTAPITTTQAPTYTTPATIANPSLVATPDPYADLLKILPGLAGMNAQAGSVINNQLAGRVNPDVERATQDYSNRLGGGGQMGTVGIPGSLANFGALASYGKLSSDEQAKGLASYGDFLKTIVGTQVLSPSVQANIGQFNANAQNDVNAANTASLNNYAQFYQNLLNNSNQFNTGQTNQINLANAGAGNATNLTNVGIADRNATNAAAADPWLALNYAADLLARNSAATAGRPYNSMFNPNTSTGQFGGWATSSPAGGTVDPWTAYMNKVLARQKTGQQTTFM